MEILTKCKGGTFSLMGDNRADFFEEVEYFKYFGRIKHRAVEVWSEFLRNIWKARQVWGQLGKILRREVADRSSWKSSTAQWFMRC